MRRRRTVCAANPRARVTEDGPASVVFDAAENHLRTEPALLVTLLREPGQG